VALDDEMQARAGSFGIDAEAYDRHRPSYPAVVVDVLLAGDTRDVVDVGCGTGKLSRLLAERGAAVLGVEPDARMAEVARRHGIAVEVSPFESWDVTGRRFDLVTSAQAWHWVDQAAGAAKAAEALVPGGRLAVVWNIGRHDDHAQVALDRVYGEHMPQNVSTGSLGRVGDEKWHLAGVDETAAFGEQQVWSTQWQQDHSAAEWLDHLGTMSDHRLLPDAQRAALFAGVAAVIEGELGGTITLHYDTRVISAVRR
jgi:SAM-dependent methyltransferase